MNDRPTPETDAETNYCDAMPDMPWVDAEVARKLERERDEALEERDISRLEFEEISNDLSDSRKRIWQLEKQIEELNNFANERYDEMQKIRNERDEAREELQEWKDGAYAAEHTCPDEVHCTCVPLLRCSLELARKERDEAREENKFLRVFLAHIRDNAYIRYGKRRGLLAFSDIKEEVSRKCKLFRQCQEDAK